ncbi:DNA-binding transcription factor [Schizosaccharomyces pombe]|uniref:Uncharacterized transcriptional regulatory protein C965.10 n=1 Tax=Schizosaccharomyces pombe (strain 972 / ATCC 24843) TaxID=284812 RepID=YCUA_SCHPO|nr:putative transcription factor [Schizosaccharomyces pombe]O59830.1 RecName: Full=Uncharacterized transcriptional regulatory protein C965.10 [Schizosaccharomyces pombe 972h-]CAA19070.1 transcription factor (predicted) [Schizosaccharomyces pombe]|eukprot:NP_588520.1 putative transcription factor [Schizosaccharomyces pombe]
MTSTSHFVASTVKKPRSRYGCLICRSMRKKCDEVHPQCGRCLKAGKQCIWKQPGTERKNKTKWRKAMQNNSIPIQDLADDFELDFPDTLDLTNPDALPVLGESIVNPISLPVDVASPFLPSECYPSKVELPYFPLLSKPNTLLSLLNDEEISCCEYYCYSVAPITTILPGQPNFLPQLLLPMALHEESVLYSLVASGYRLKYGNDNSLALQKSKVFVNRALLTLPERRSLNLSKSEFVVSLACYILLVYTEIAFADTTEWATYFLNAYNMINKMGGFKILKECSSEGKLLAECFAYFDILASQSNLNGTYYSISDYTDVYGVDELQLFESLENCIKPLVLIIGDIINLLVESRRAGFDDLQHTLNIYEKSQTIEGKIWSCVPQYEDMKSNKLDSEKSEPLQLFKLYKTTTEMYLRQVISRMPPVSLEMQVLLHKQTQLIDLLLESSLRNSLSFPMLIAGLNAATDLQRTNFKNRVNCLCQNYTIGSLKKVWIVVQEIWKMNQNGNICIDWYEVVQKFGWRLNTGV